MDSMEPSSINPVYRFQRVGEWGGGGWCSVGARQGRTFLALSSFSYVQVGPVLAESSDSLS